MNLGASQIGSKRKSVTFSFYENATEKDKHGTLTTLVKHGNFSSSSSPVSSRDESPEGKPRFQDLDTDSVVSCRSKKQKEKSWYSCCCKSKFEDFGTDKDSTTTKDSSVVTVAGNEDEVIARLQQAVSEMGHIHQPQCSIETEIERWHAVLEKEQKAYDESGIPKFKYKWFRKNRYLMARKHPLYGTRYDNHRKLEARREYFKFGVNIDERFDITGDEIRFKHFDIYDRNTYTDHWKTDTHTLFATMALICSANSFIRFPMACYANGGFTFLLTYCLMVVTVGQPLLYFEMAIGQYSLHGPSGFGRLHPYAKGIPYAAAFMCIVFGTAKSVMLGYCMLYPLISLTASPGKCDSIWNIYSNCIPYINYEWRPSVEWEQRRQETPPKTVFSTELFFREAVLNSDWETKVPFRSLHWKLVIAYCLVCAIAYIPIHYNLTGRTMKRWLHYCLVLPIMVFILFLHQSFGRGGIYQAVEYFLYIDTQHVSALSLWSEAFDMMLGTLGIGYGYHWCISGRTPFNYKDTYKDSWIICGCSMLFGVIGSLVMFLETGIVGKLTMDKSHFHVFQERLGISFVCYSGALLKLGSSSTVFVPIFFTLFIVFGMWSQIITADIILRWIEHGHIIQGKIHRVVKRKTSSIFIVIGVQLAIISPYLFHEAASVLDAENVFGGSFAAYTVVLAELITVVYLYGFARFLVDLEIMIKKPLPVLFQIQIRYVVFPAIGIFIFPMLINVYAVPSIYADRNSIGWMFWVGVAENMAPMVILVTFAILGVLAERNEIGKQQIHPEPYQYAPTESTREETCFDPRFVARSDAPSQQSHNRTIRTETYYVTEHNMQYIYQAQKLVEKEFKKLLKFKLLQLRWLHLMLALLIRRRIHSFPTLVQRIMLYRKNEYNKHDIDFLEKTLAQIVNFKFYSAMRKLQRMPISELLPYLVDELIHLTISHSDEFDSSESESSSEDDNNRHPSEGKIEKISSSSSASSDENEIHKVLTGKLVKSLEESRLLMVIRLKKGLGLPFIGELNLLAFLRRQRAKKERERSVWAQNDSPPIDHFIPSSIKRNHEIVLTTIFHAVVVEGNGHFALKKLPVPRPAIVRVTKSFIHSQPGQDFTHKISKIVIKRMSRNTEEIIEKRNPLTWSKQKQKRNLWRVADRMDEDVYDFLDRLLTCIIVIVDDHLKADVSRRRQKKWYVRPTTRRHVHPDQATNLTVNYKDDFEITTYGALTYRQLQQQKWLDKVMKQPSDILYHSEDSSEDLTEEVFEAKSSSGSSASVSVVGDDNDMFQSLLGSFSSGGGSQSRPGGTGAPKATYVLENETLQARDTKSLAFKVNVGDTPTTTDLWVRPRKVKHISARRWQRDHRKRSHSAPPLSFTKAETALHDAVDAQAAKQALLSIDSTKSIAFIDSEDVAARRAVSLQSYRYILDSDLQFDIQEGELVAIPNVDLIKRRQEEKLSNNTTTGLSYFSYGKTMMVFEGNAPSDVSLGRQSTGYSGINSPGFRTSARRRSNSFSMRSSSRFYSSSPGGTMSNVVNVPRPNTNTFQTRIRRNSLTKN